MNKEKVEELNKLKKKFIREYYFMEFMPQYIVDEGLRLKQVAYFIANAKNIAIITGAGMSTDSGIPDFRSKNGIYSNCPEKVFSKKNFKENPKELINVLLKLFNKNYDYNYGHLFLKKLEEEKTVNIITQNIDTMEDVLSNVTHIHGSIKHAKCLKCGNIYEILWREDNVTMEHYICDCGEHLKPDIVLYGEDVNELDKCINIVEDCDLLLVLGSSLTVEPVASLPLKSKLSTPIIIVNNDATPLDDKNNVIKINKNISETFKIINDLLF